MRTLEFTNALKEIVTEMKVRELIGLLEPLLTQPQAANQGVSDPLKAQFSALLFGSHAGFERLRQSADTRKVLNHMAAGELYEPTLLGRMITGLNSASNFQQLQLGVGFQAFHVFLYMLRSLRQIATTCTALLEKEKIGDIPESDGRLS